MKLSPADQAKLDAIVADGMAAWHRADLIAYHLGFVRAGPATWTVAAIDAAPGAGKRFGKPNATELKPVPLDLLPSGGAKA